METQSREANREISAGQSESEALLDPFTGIPDFIRGQYVNPDTEGKYRLWAHLD